MSKLLGLASTLMSIKDVALSTLAQFDMSKVENMLLNAQERTTSSGAVAQDQLELHVNKTQGMQPRETLATLAALIQQHFGLNINDADDGTLAALADLVQEQYGLNINDAGGMQLNETLAILADIMQKYFGLDINHALGMQPDTNRDQGTLAALVTEHIESLENTPSTSDPAPNMNNGALNQQNLNDEDHYEVDPDADDAEPYSESEEYYQDYDPDQLYTDSEEEDSEAIHTSSHENYKNDPRVGPSTNITSVTTAGPTQDENQPLMGEMSGVCNSTLGIENLNLSSKSADSGDADDSYLMHQFASIFPSDFLSIQLIKLSIKEVQEMLGQVHYFKEILGHLCQTVESHGFDGITLSFTNLDEVKESLNLDYGYWELFQMLILESGEYYQHPEQLYSDSEEEDSEVIHTSSQENNQPTAGNLQSYSTHCWQLAISDFLSIKLIKLSPKEVQEMLGQVHYFKEILGMQPDTNRDQGTLAALVTEHIECLENTPSTSGPAPNMNNGALNQQNLNDEDHYEVDPDADDAEPYSESEEYYQDYDPEQLYSDSEEEDSESTHCWQLAIKSIAKVFFGKSKNDPRVDATTNTTSVTTAGPTQGVCNSTLGMGIENRNLSSKSADSGDDSYLMHRFATIFPSDFLSIKLIKLSPKEVQEMLGQVHYFKEILGHLCQIVEMYRLDGITLSFTNLEVLKELEIKEFDKTFLTFLNETVFCHCILDISN
ncbi:hypothetical protein Bhyg_02240, partial [Pseudolycoriella hygida]